MGELDWLWYLVLAPLVGSGGFVIMLLAQRKINHDIAVKVDKEADLIEANPLQMGETVESQQARIRKARNL